MWTAIMETIGRCDLLIALANVMRLRAFVAIGGHDLWTAVTDRIRGKNSSRAQDEWREFTDLWMGSADTICARNSQTRAVATNHGVEFWTIRSGDTIHMQKVLDAVGGQGFSKGFAHGIRGQYSVTRAMKKVHQRDLCSGLAHGICGWKVATKFVHGIHGQE